MDIEGKKYQVSFHGGGTLKMTGRLAAMPEEYKKIEEMFENVIEKISESGMTELLLDLRELVYLNSSGIKTVCVSLVMEADDVEGLHLKILCKESLTWQVESIPNFKGLMDNLEIIFE